MSNDGVVIAHIERNYVTITGKPGHPDRRISHVDLATGLLNAAGNADTSAEDDTVALKSPLILPPNVYLMGRGKSSLQMGMYYKGRVIPEVKFNNGGTIKSYKNVIFPNIIFSVTLRNTNDPRDKKVKYKYSSWRVFATDRHVLSLPEQMITRDDRRSHIWTLPLPNVYDDARVCLGGNSIFTTFTDDLRTLGYMYRMLIDSPFNGDLSIPSLAHRDYSPRDWIEYLSGRDTFPYEKLSGFNSDLHKRNTEDFNSNELK